MGATAALEAGCITIKAARRSRTARSAETKPGTEVLVEVERIIGVFKEVLLVTGLMGATAGMGQGCIIMVAAL